MYTLKEIEQQGTPLHLLDSSIIDRQTDKRLSIYVSLIDDKTVYVIEHTENGVVTKNPYITTSVIQMGQYVDDTLRGGQPWNK